MIIHPDGLYFGMPDEEYHDDPALGASDHKRLLVSPPRWWLNSPHGKELRDALAGREEVEKVSLAKTFGTAAHAIVLEGEVAFNERYWTRPEPPPELLVHKADIRQAVFEKTGRMPLGSLLHPDMVLEARRAGVGPLAEDWEMTLAEERFGREEISGRWDRIMKLIAHMIDLPRPDYGGKSQRQYILANGYPEVSVFYTDENGVRLKARIDWLRVKSMVDLKTYSAKDDEESIAAFLRAVEQFAYDLQAVHYEEMRARIPELIKAGCVFGEVEDRFLGQLAAYEGEVAWTWLAVQTVGLPETDVLTFPNGLISQSASYQLQMARAKYVEYRDRFGLDEPWVTTRGTITLDDDVFEAAGRMRRMQSRGDELYRLHQ